MKVVLAGYNVDTSVLEELKSAGQPRSDVTPETMAAAYARISRDPRSIVELRAEARQEVERARKSNQTIIFKMGHHSVAEHAVFNFDIIGISRLAIEELEKFRLCSYTEKSQRYNKLKDDYIIPKEIKAAGKKTCFEKVIREQNALYHRLYQQIRPHMFSAYPDLAAEKRRRSILDGWAKEDARYIVSLATEGQLGMTANARNLEFMLRRFASKKMEELRELQHKLYDLAKKAAPSIILFTEENDFDSRTYPELKAISQDLIENRKSRPHNPVRLVDFTADADIRLAAVLLHSSTNAEYAECFRRAGAVSGLEREKLVKASFRHMEFFDHVLREFEHLDLTFELVLSSACFAQLKRHRMATLTAQDYDPELGVTVPPSVKAVGMEAEFMAQIERTNGVYRILRDALDVGADYVLTNAHRRRVLFKLNAREFYHFSRLREDGTAQWDIRELAGQMTEEARRVMPLTMLLIGGKDAYPHIYRKAFGKPPKQEPPPFC